SIQDEPAHLQGRPVGRPSDSGVCQGIALPGYGEYEVGPRTTALPSRLQLVLEVLPPGRFGRIALDGVKPRHGLPTVANEARHPGLIADLEGVDAVESDGAVTGGGGLVEVGLQGGPSLGMLLQEGINQ